MANRRIVLVGDSALECGVALVPAMRHDDASGPSISLGRPLFQDGDVATIRGGIWRIQDYLLQAHGGECGTSVAAYPDSEEPASDNSPRIFVKLDRFPLGMMHWDKPSQLWLPTGGKENKTYRISNIEGRNHPKDEFHDSLGLLFNQSNFAESVKECHVLVVCDRNLGFRRFVAQSRFGKVFAEFLTTLRYAHADRSPGRIQPRVVLETTDPIDEHHGKLLAILRERGLLGQTVVVTSANSLKSSGVVFRDDLSLERAVEDFAQLIEKITCLANGRRAAADLDAEANQSTDRIWEMLVDVRCLVVRLGSRAALLWEPRPGASAGTHSPERPGTGTIRFIFDDRPYEPQTSPAAESSDLGTMFGYSSLLAAELAVGLSELEASETQERFSECLWKSVAHGLTACRLSFEDGLGATPNDFPKRFERLAEMELGNASTFHIIDGKDAQDHPREWTIHQVAGVRRRVVYSPKTRFKERAADLQERPTLTGDLAVQVVQRGLEVLAERGVPYVELVKLTTADRHEIENYAGITNLVTKYMDNSDWSKPLCLGVFGPPGCGKSFGIEQIVESIRGYKTKQFVHKMTVNLSQLASADQLAKAFHRVRSEGLAGKLPLVFVDEFDSNLGDREYGWLKYLLAPMQDGTFLDNDEIYHLPRCLLVFIGGQNRDFVELESRLRDERFIAAKGRDFISRLRHYLVVKGPDLPGPGDARIANGKPKCWAGRRLRRAMLLRSVFEIKLPIIIETEIDALGRRVRRANVDERIINAFLGVACFKHGVRSLEAIVDMSRASVTRKSFQVSSLPPEEQLELHVDANEFLRFINEGE